MGTITGPVAPLTGTRMARLDALIGMGAPMAEDLRHEFPTADVAVDPDRGILFIACDPEPDPVDWATVVGLIKAVGFDNGGFPHHLDPGEPDYDPFLGVCTWRLEYAYVPCIMCDGHGRLYGCPLCGTIRAGDN